MKGKNRIGRVILRNLSKSLLTQLSILDELDATDEPPISLIDPQCLVCSNIVRLQEEEEEKMMTKEEREKRERCYEDTLSAAIDRFERLKLGGIKQEENEEERKGEEEEEWRKLGHCEVQEIEEEYRERVLKCTYASSISIKS